MTSTKAVLVVLVLLCVCSCGCSPARRDTARQTKQFPSPMTDAIRAHERIEDRALPGVSIILNHALSKLVEVYGLTILAFAGNTAPDHIDHFHGLPAFLRMILE